MGFNYSDIIDPLNRNMIQEIRIRARANTLAYRNVFACYPDDTVTNLQEYKDVLFHHDNDISLSWDRIMISMMQSSYT